MESIEPAPNGTRYEGRATCLGFWQALAADRSTAFAPEDVVVAGDRATIRWRYRFGDGPDDSVRGVEPHARPRRPHRRGARLLEERRGCRGRGPRLRPRPQPLSAGRIGRQERLELQLGHRHVDRGRERGERRDEREVAARGSAAGAGPRSRGGRVPASRSGRSVSSSASRSSSAGLGVRSRGPAQRVEHVAGPVREVGDAGRHAVGVQGQAEAVDRLLTRRSGAAPSVSTSKGGCWRRRRRRWDRRRPRARARGPARIVAAHRATGAESLVVEVRLGEQRRVAGRQQQTRCDRGARARATRPGAPPWCARAPIGPARRSSRDVGSCPPGWPARADSAVASSASPAARVVNRLSPVTLPTLRW